VKRTFLFAICVVALLSFGVSATAAPSGAVVQLHYQQSPERRTVMAATDAGLVFIGEDFSNFRAFRSSANGGEFLWITDIDNDRDDEYVFGGNPSFALDGDADPYFGLLDGCDDFFVGNILDDEAQELFCRKRNTISVWYYDGQFLWEYSVTGMRLNGCQADDVDSDERLEFACESSEGWVLIDIANDEPVQNVPDNPAESGVRDQMALFDAEATAIFSGERTFDIDGDGSADESLRFSGGTLTINGAGGALMGTAALSESGLYSATVADLNGDGTNEIFVGGEGTVYVLSPAGEQLAAVNARPGSLDRDARVTIRSANANGLEDSSSETTQAAVNDGMSALTRCYSRRMGRDQFVKVGSMGFQLTVSGRGRVSAVQGIGSEVRDNELEECITNALEDLRFSNAADGDGTVTVRLALDFVDQ